ncbi:pyruvate, phosphate dikinase [Bradyrhizobium sp. 6(2017)]|uniref:pyruvate, phosphate dikinase n=1 Tax=Bradyrhizobium sp. 6(2017) TaxID=1197460 RepID=UPI0013E1A4B7|nr:pyruvate, phosphate dikinase [Bradyrhizobium sp. 6(2017)]QIG94161.1 pyruvate, phosphate dikinase [Bradyrhizobium sp. 6(2017)]
MHKRVMADAMDTIFVREVTDHDVEDALRFGGKASGLAKMARAGIPIPPAFVIGVEGFRQFRASRAGLGEGLLAQIHGAIRNLENQSGRSFADKDRPLLVSVRSGAPVSMPGMMDTILNLGLTAASAHSLAQGSGGSDFALDTWMRFWRMFADIVLGIDPSELVESVKEAESIARQELTASAFQNLERAILDRIEAAGEAASADPFWQLEKAVEAVFRSWDSARAKAYRKHHGISDDLGTAVTIQAMVFGNADGRSGSGVAFTRNPNDGSKALYGEYLIGRQGEDLVSGTHTPIDLSQPDALDPQLRHAFETHSETLEELYADAVDIEFTVESGKLYFLQVRPAKRTAAAAIKIAEDLVAEGLIDERTALGRITSEQVRKVSRPSFEEAELAGTPVLAQGLGSSPGHAHGAAVLDADRAADLALSGEAVILLRPTTSPQDIRGMLAANGVITARGGALSHAAVVSRALDRPCIVGCEAIEVDLNRKTFSIAGKTFGEGDQISMDGASGKIFAGALKLKPAGAGLPSLKHILEWADRRSEAAIWLSPKSGEELLEATSAGRVVSVTDLIIAKGSVGRFVELTAASGLPTASRAVADEIRSIVCEACVPAFLGAADGSVQFRLPRVSSDRARRLIENWQELPPNFFLPLGSLNYLRAILLGIAAAAESARYRDATALIGGISSSSEFAAFQREVRQVGLGAGAMIQNVMALDSVVEIAGSAAPIWVDIGDVVRTIYGFPIEVQQSLEVLDQYVSEDLVRANPFRRLPSYATNLLTAAVTAAEKGAQLGIEGSTVPSELLVELHRLGFRRFSVPTGRRDELRFLLGRSLKE